MPSPRKRSVAARKRPRQGRSKQLVAAILEAAIRVLTKQGAARFTTARVAEQAGVSVGSLYQYFPNKAAILFRLQADEWLRTSQLLDEILTDAAREPLERLREMVLVFFESECEEADYRSALEDAAPFYRSAPESRAKQEAGRRRMLEFMRAALPGINARQRAFCTDLVRITLSSVGKRVSEQNLTRAEVRGFAGAIADMLCGYLADVATSRRPGRESTRAEPLDMK